MQGKGEGEAGGGEKTGEHTSRQAAGLFWSTSEYQATTPRMPSGISHKASFLQSWNSLLE